MQFRQNNIFISAHLVVLELQGQSKTILFSHSTYSAMYKTGLFNFSLIILQAQIITLELEIKELQPGGDGEENIGPVCSGHEGS